MIKQTRIESGEIRGVSSSDLNVTMFPLQTHSFFES